MSITNKRTPTNTTKPNQSLQTDEESEQQGFFISLRQKLQASLDGFAKKFSKWVTPQTKGLSIASKELDPDLASFNNILFGLFTAEAKQIKLWFKENPGNNAGYQSFKKTLSRQANQIKSQANRLNRLGPTALDTYVLLHATFLAKREELLRSQAEFKANSEKKLSKTLTDQANVYAIQAVNLTTKPLEFNTFRSIMIGLYKSRSNTILSSGSNWNKGQFQRNFYEFHGDTVKDLANSLGFGITAFDVVKRGDIDNNINKQKKGLEL